jgi:hypothetical protein
VIVGKSNLTLILSFLKRKEFFFSLSPKRREKKVLLLPNPKVHGGPCSNE